MITPIALSTFAAASSGASLSSTWMNSLSLLIQDILLHPENHMMPVIIFSVVVVALVVGAVYLTKKIYERYHCEATL